MNEARTTIVVFVFDFDNVITRLLITPSLPLAGFFLSKWGRCTIVIALFLLVLLIIIKDYVVVVTLALITPSFTLAKQFSRH
jgi:hypothetical protein